MEEEGIILKTIRKGRKRGRGLDFLAREREREAEVELSKRMEQ
jgi:uncharacterized protein YicC (UPF0701 family)